MIDSDNNYTSPLIDIIIVNWNSSALLKNCIESILFTENEKYVKKVIVVDNNSSDESMNHIPNHAKIEPILNQENKGFAKAANQGFYKSNAEYALLLNPDTRLRETTLADSIRFMEKRKDISIMGCQLFDETGAISPSCSRFPTPLSFAAEAFGITKIAPEKLKLSLVMVDWDHRSSRFVDQVMGAFMLMRPHVFQTVGYFDERFFVYFEDLDFSKRLANAGMRSFYNADIKAIHIGKGTTSNVKAFRLALFLRSRLAYAKKHFSLPGYLFVYLTTCLVEPVTRMIYCLLTGNFEDAKETIVGYRMLFTGHPKKKYRRGGPSN